MPLSNVLLERLSSSTGDLRSPQFVEEHPEVRGADVVVEITDHANRVAREDLGRAEDLAKLAVWLADLTGDSHCSARAARCAGNMKVLRGNHQAAVEDFAFALSTFEKLHNGKEQAATLASSLQPLIYLGRYSEAFANAGRARQIAEDSGDELLLARITINFANILHRQDRFKEAVEYYESALAILTNLGQLRDCAIALLNLAVCYISLNDYARAEQAYERARMISKKESMPRVVAQADYNIAYLYYYRGEYAKAIELYRETKTYCQGVDDDYHRALCDLDQAEMYLELHLNDETANLARMARTAFEHLKMPYEVAKATVWQGLAAYQEKRPFRSIELFIDAREQMEKERNLPWVATLDLFHAIVLRHEGRYFEALKVCKSSQHLFDSLPKSVKSVHATLLRALLHLDFSQPSHATDWSVRARDMAERLHSAHLLSDAYRVLGRVAESESAVDEAMRFYHRALEYSGQAPLRTGSDTLKIPYLKSPVEIHEAVTALALSSNGPYDLPSIFEEVERATSQNISELLSFRATAIPGSVRGRSPLVEQLKALRQELNWYYKQSDNFELLDSKKDIERDDLRRKINDREVVLLGVLDKLRHTDEEFYSIQTGSTVGLTALQERVQDDEVLVEFFECRGSIWAFLVTRDQSELIPITRTHLIRAPLRRLQNSLLNSPTARIGTEKDTSSFDRTQSALQELYTNLIVPIRPQIDKRRLILIPCGPLWYVPFHALFDGSRYLTEELVMSYAMSASQYFLNTSKHPVVTDTKVFVGDGSLEPCLATIHFQHLQNVAALSRQPGPYRFLHFAGGLAIREDNPFFSQVRIGDADLNIVDIFNLDLSASVLTLTGGGSLIRASGEGDEVRGLTRALEYSGARTVLLPIWSTDGPSNSVFMQSFYRAVENDGDKALAFQTAMAHTREQFPAPFSWAAFRILGQTGRQQ